MRQPAGILPSHSLHHPPPPLSLTLSLEISLARSLARSLVLSLFLSLSACLCLSAQSLYFSVTRPRIRSPLSHFLPPPPLFCWFCASCISRSLLSHLPSCRPFSLSSLSLSYSYRPLKGKASNERQSERDIERERESGAGGGHDPAHQGAIERERYCVCV